MKNSESPLLSHSFVDTSAVNAKNSSSSSSQPTTTIISDDEVTIKTAILARVVERFRFLIPPSRLNDEVSEKNIRFMLGLDISTRVQRRRTRTRSLFLAEDDATVLTEEADSLALRLWQLVSDLPAKPTFLSLLEFESEHFPYTTEEQRHVLANIVAANTSRTVVTKNMVAIELGIISTMHHFEEASSPTDQQKKETAAESLDDNKLIKCLFGPINEMPAYVFAQLVKSLSEHPNTSTFLTAAAESVTVSKKNMSLLLPMLVVFVLSLIIVPTFDIDALYRSGFTAAFPGTDDWVDGCGDGGPTSSGCHALKENLEKDLTLVANVQGFFQKMVISQVWPPDLGNGTSLRASNTLYFGQVLVGGMLLKSSPLTTAVTRETMLRREMQSGGSRRTVVVSAPSGGAAAPPVNNNASSISTSTTLTAPPITTTTSSSSSSSGDATTTTATPVPMQVDDEDAEVLVAKSQAGSSCPMRTCQDLNLSSYLHEFRISGSFTCDAFASNDNTSIVLIPFNTTRREALALASKFVPDFCDAASDTAVTLSYHMWDPSSEVLSFVTLSAVVPRAGFVLPRATVQSMNLNAIAPVTLLLLAQLATFAWIIFFATLRNITESELASAEHIASDDSSLVRKNESYLAAAKRWRQMSPSAFSCVSFVTKRVFAAAVRGFLKHIKGYFTLQILWQLCLTVLLFYAWILLLQLPTQKEIQAAVVQAEYMPPGLDASVFRYNLAMDIVATFFLIFFLASCQLLANVLGLSIIWRLLVLSAPDVLGLSIVFFFVELGFVGLGKTLFGMDNQVFAYTSTTSAWLLDAYFGIADLNAVIEQAPAFGVIFFFIHLAFAILFALNLLIAVLCAELEFVTEGASLWNDFLLLVESDASNFRNEEERWFPVRKLVIPCVSVANDSWILAKGSRRWNEFRRFVSVLWRPQTRASPTPTVLLLENAISLINFCTSDTAHCFAAASPASPSSTEHQQQESATTPVEEAKQPAVWDTVLRRAVSKYDSSIFPDRTSWVIIERIILGETDSNLLRDTVLARIMVSYDEYTTDIQKIMSMQTEQRAGYARAQHEAQQQDEQREQFYRAQKMKIAAAAADKKSKSSNSDSEEEMKEKNQSSSSNSRAAAARAKLSKSLKKLIFTKRFVGGKKKELTGQQQSGEGAVVNLSDLVNFDESSGDGGGGGAGGGGGGISFSSDAAPASSGSGDLFDETNRQDDQQQQQQQQQEKESSADDLLMMSFARAPIQMMQQQQEENKDGEAEKRKLRVKDRWRAVASSAKDKKEQVESQWVAAAAGVKQQQQQKEKVKRRWRAAVSEAKEHHDEVEAKWRATAADVVHQHFEEEAIAAAADLFGADDDDDDGSEYEEYEELEEEEEEEQNQASGQEKPQQQQQQQQQQPSEPEPSFAIGADNDGDDFLADTLANNFASQEVGISFDEEGGPKRGTFSSFHASARKLRFLFNAFLLRDIKNHLYFPLFSFVSALFYVGLLVPILEHRESGAWFSENLEGGLRDNPYETKCDDPQCRSGFLHRKEFNDIAYASDIEQYFQLRFAPVIWPESLPFVVPRRFAAEENSSHAVAFDPFIRRVSPVTVRQVRAARKPCSLPGASTIRAALGSGSGNNQQQQQQDPLREATLLGAECYGSIHSVATDDLERPAGSLLAEEDYRWREDCVEKSGVAGHFAHYPCQGVSAVLHNASQAKELPRWLSPAATLVVISATFRASLAGENLATDSGANTTYSDPFSALDSGGKQKSSSSSSSNNKSSSSSSGNDFLHGDFGASELFGDLLDASVNLTARIDLYVELQPGGGSAAVFAYTNILSGNSLFRYSTAGFLQIALEMLIFLGRLAIFLHSRYSKGDLVRAAHGWPGVPVAAIGATIWTLAMLVTPSELHLKHSRILAGLCVSSTWLFLRNVIFPCAKLVTHRSAGLLRIMELSLGAFWAVVPYMFLTTVAFIWSSHLFFGKEVDEMATLRHTVRFVVRGLLFEWDSEKLSDKRPYLSLIVTMSFFFVSLVVITNLLLTLMTGAIGEAREIGSELIERTAGLIGQKLYCDEAMATWLAWHCADDNVLKRITMRMCGRGDTKSGGAGLRDRDAVAQRQFFVTRAGRFCRPAEAVMFLVPCNQFTELAEAISLDSVPENILWSVALYIVSRRRKFRVDFRDQATLDETLEAKLSGFAAF